MLKNFLKRYVIHDHMWVGRPHSTCTKNVANAVHARITQNSCCKQKILSQEINLAQKMILCVLTEDLSLRAYKMYTKHLLSVRSRRLWIKRSKELLHVYGKILFKKIIFKNQKIFNIEQKSNKQNNKVHARALYKAKMKVTRTQTSHQPSSQMVWWGVS